MDIAQFDVLAESLREQSAASLTRYGFPLIEGRTATDDEVSQVETRLGVNNYKAFMVRYGGGMFGSVELFPIVSRESDHDDDLLSVNDREFPDRTFVAVAPVGTGDHWGSSSAADMARGLPNGDCAYLGLPRRPCAATREVIKMVEEHHLASSQPLPVDDRQVGKRIRKVFVTRHVHHGTRILATG